MLDDSDVWWVSEQVSKNKATKALVWRLGLPSTLVSQRDMQLIDAVDRYRAVVKP